MAQSKTGPDSSGYGAHRLHSPLPEDCSQPPFGGSYLAAVTDFTEMVSPLAVPVTLACSQASLLSSSSAV